MNEDDREKEILKQKTKSGVLIKKKRMGKVVYIEKNRISNPHRTRFIFILFLRKSCLRKQSELQRNLCVLWTVDGAVFGAIRDWVGSIVGWAWVRSPSSMVDH